MRKNAVGFAKHPGSYVGEGCCNGWSVRVRGKGLVRSKEATLATREGERPHINMRGYHTRNLLEGGLLGCFLLVLAARSGARGTLLIGGGGVVVWV